MRTHACPQLVASLERLLQKSPAADGQAALLTSLRAPAPGGSSSAAASGLHRQSSGLPSPLSAAGPPAPAAPADPRQAGGAASGSRWQFLASRAASFRSPPAGGLGGLEGRCMAGRR